MATAQVTLTEAESETLRAIAQRTGKTQEQLLHEAVGSFLAQSKQQNRLALLQQAKGIWKDRRDLPELEELRAGFDRF